MLGGQSTGLDCPLERLVDGFRLVGIGACEAGESSVRDVAFAEVAREHRGTRRTSVAFGEQGAANPAIIHER